MNNAIRIRNHRLIDTTDGEDTDDSVAAIVMGFDRLGCAGNWTIKPNLREDGAR